MPEIHRSGLTESYSVRATGSDSVESVMLITAMLTLLTAFGGEAFSPLEHDEAIARAQTQDRLLLVDFTATWCGPCKRMEKTTWVDPTVLAWLDEHGLAIQVDVDDQSELAQRYRIQAMPTIVAMRDGHEVDRVVGYRSADQMLEWLEDVSEGRTAADAVRERVASDDTDVDARLDLARTLSGAGRDAEALEQYLWLWNHMLEYKPSMYGVRLSFMLGDIEKLIQRDEPARQAFRKIFDEDQDLIDAGTAELGTWMDWTHLADTLDMRDEQLTWIHEHVDEQGRISSVPNPVLDDIAAALVERGRLAEAGALYPDPVGTAEQMASQIEMMRGMGQFDGETLAMLVEHSRGQLERLRDAVSAAGREEDAEGVAAVLAKTFEDESAR